MGVHVILGLPGESAADMLATARCLARLGVASVKMHNLYAVRGTRLAEMLAAGEVRLPERDEYVRYVVDFSKSCRPAASSIASAATPRASICRSGWCSDKAAVRAAVDAEFSRRGSWQGCKWTAAVVNVNSRLRPKDAAFTPPSPPGTRVAGRGRWEGRNHGVSCFIPTGRSRWALVSPNTTRSCYFVVAALAGSRSKAARARRPWFSNVRPKSAGAKLLSTGGAGGPSFGSPGWP